MWSQLGVAILIAAVLAAGGLIAFRRPRRRTRDVEEAIQQAALDRAAERELDDVIYLADRYNVRRTG